MLKSLKRYADGITTTFLDTLNVKLRYEQIIKNVIENERKGDQLTVKQVIKRTKVEKVSMSKLVNQGSHDAIKNSLILNYENKTVANCINIDSKYESSPNNR